MNIPNTGVVVYVSENNTDIMRLAIDQYLAKRSVDYVTLEMVPHSFDSIVQACGKSSKELNQYGIDNNVIFRVISPIPNKSILDKINSLTSDVVCVDYLSVQTETDKHEQLVALANIVETTRRDDRLVIISLKLDGEISSEDFNYLMQVCRIDKLINQSTP